MGGSSDIQVSHQFERPAFPQTLEELELEYTRDAMELEKKREKEEDEENNKHREVRDPVTYVLILDSNRVLGAVTSESTMPATMRVSYYFTFWLLIVLDSSGYLLDLLL